MNDIALMSGNIQIQMSASHTNEENIGRETPIEVL